MNTRLSFLQDAFALKRKAAVAAPAGPAAEAPAGAAVRAAGADPAAGTGDDVSAGPGARSAATVLLGVGALLAWALDKEAAAFEPKEGFAIFAGFYLAAQAIERLLEIVPAGIGSKQAKADRAVIFPAIAFVLGVVLAEKLGLYYVSAIGVADVPKTWDIIITALAIGGGTKPLHDGIKRLEKAKETPAVSH